MADWQLVVLAAVALGFAIEAALVFFSSAIADKICILGFGEVLDTSPRSD